LLLLSEAKGSGQTYHNAPACANQLYLSKNFGQFIFKVISSRVFGDDFAIGIK
jgi:hypothetical protein